MTVQHPNADFIWQSPDPTNRTISREDLALLGNNLGGLALGRGITRGLSTKIPDQILAEKNRHHNSRHTRPVTMIIDDFHNADNASIHLLSGIMSHTDIGYSFILLTSSLEGERR